MKETNYIESFSQICKGLKGIALSISATIMNNIILTLFIMSAIANVFMGVLLAKERTVRDRQDVEICKVIQQNDSLRGANIKYYKYEARN